MVIFYLLIFEQCFIWSQFYVQCLKAFQEHIFLVWHAFGKMIGGVLESQKVSSHTIIFLLAMSFPCCSFHIKKKKKLSIVTGQIWDGLQGSLVLWTQIQGLFIYCQVTIKSWMQSGVSEVLVCSTQLFYLLWFSCLTHSKVKYLQCKRRAWKWCWKSDSSENDFVLSP